MNMAQINVTEDENQKTFKEMFGSAEFHIRAVDGELIFLSQQKSNKSQPLAPK